MPVPTWDCSNLGLMDEPQDTTTVVSEDVWKKFDLDFPLDIYHDHAVDDAAFPELYDKVSSDGSREIRHHDCMWAGLCISKEHSRTVPTRKDNFIQKMVPAGRSLLIARAPQQCHSKSLESDGDSTRPETPQSSESDVEVENPRLKHDRVNGKLSEYLGEFPKAAPVSEVTGQLVRRMYNEKRRQDEKVDGNGLKKETQIRNTLNDHCYHLNQATNKRLEHLGVQTPSDSEEEIDVVSFDKPCRPAVLPTYPNPADEERFQLTVNTVFKKSPGARPRGRPPSSTSRKRRAEPAEPAEKAPAKRARTRGYQKRSKVTKNTAAVPTTTIATVPTTTTTTIAKTPAKASTKAPTKASTKMSSASRSNSDSEPDTEKRSLHNNMERQRRIELRNAFEDLRLLVPEVEMEDKAPKVAILRQAAAYCDMLTKESQTAMDKVSDMKLDQVKLRAKLRLLRRCFAMTR